MALTNCYVTLPAVKDALGIKTTDNDASLDGFVTSACRAIDFWCGQFFYDTLVASARTFRVDEEYCATVDPFLTTVTPVIETDPDSTGAFSTLWAVTDYELERFGGDMADMLAAPYNRIHAVDAYIFPTYTRRRHVLRVTARWGWAAVPPQVKSAAELVSIDLWSRRRAPFGVQTTEFGPLRVSSDIVSKVEGLVGPFRDMARVGGIG